MIVAGADLLGFEIQPLLRLVCSLFPKISFLGDVSGDEQIAAIRERENAGVTGIRRANLDGQCSCDKQCSQAEGECGTRATAKKISSEY